MELEVLLNDLDDCIWLDSEGRPALDSGVEVESGQSVLNREERLSINTHKSLKGEEEHVEVIHILKSELSFLQIRHVAHQREQRMEVLLRLLLVDRQHQGVPIAQETLRIALLDKMVESRQGHLALNDKGQDGGVLFEHLSR